MDIIYSPNFIRSYKKIPKQVKILAEKREIIFRKNPNDMRLKTHKLHGRLKDCWAFSINEKYRIIFEFGDDCIYFHFIGDHKVYEM